MSVAYQHFHFLVFVFAVLGATGWPGAIFGHAHVFPNWFFDYWLSGNVFSLGNFWIPLAMFIVQALVLAFGVASIRFKRRVMLAASVCLSVAVLALMFYTGKVLPYGDYQLDYYLIFPSLALFIFAFTLNEMTIGACVTHSHSAGTRKLQTLK